MYYEKLSIIFCFFLMFFSCQKNHLDKVLKHYSGDELDSLKYYSAAYLIKNAFKHGCKVEKESFGYAEMLDQLHDTLTKTNRILKYETLLDSLQNNKRPQVLFKNDADFLTPDFLIENIDLAFEAWIKMGVYNEVDFEIFKDFILPYRAGNEILDNGNREYLYNKYQWVYDSLQAGKSFKKTLIDILNFEKFNYYNGKNEIYHYSYHIKDLENKKFGSCYETSLYKINVLRALGIPSVIEGAPKWAMNEVGHGWISVYFNGEFHAIDPFNPRFEFMKYVFDNESIPKIYRNCFNKKKCDVTSTYIKTACPSIEIVFSSLTETKMQKFEIASFYREKECKFIDFGMISPNKEKVKFNNIGVDHTYIAGYREHGKFIPINYPFFIDRKAQVRFFKPDTNNLIRSKISRKYPLHTDTWRNGRKKWYKGLNGIVVETTNSNDFNISQKLFEINDTHTINPYEIKLEEIKTHSTFKIFAKTNTCQVAEIIFIGEKGNVIEESNFKFSSKDKLFDGNTLTYERLNKGKSIVISFKKPKIVSKIILQSRNDGNNIEKENIYELFYWNKKWLSLGRKKARDTVLIYENVPKNSYLWLECNKGIEEVPFSIDNQGNQIWPFMESSAYSYEVEP